MPYEREAGCMSWREQARCTEVDADLFFADKGGAADTRAAKRICQQCEVITQCLHFAMTHTGIFGVWGSTTEKERRELRRRKAS